MAHDDIFKEHYFFELARRDSLNASLSFPVGLVTLLTGAIFVMAGKISTAAGTWDVLLTIFLALCGSCLIVSTVYLVRAYWGYTYKHMPFSSQILDHRAALLKYFEAKPEFKDKATKKAAEQFDRGVNLAYATNCKINAINNDSKSSNIFKANSYIIGAIACAIASAPAYVAISYQTPSTPSQIEITNLKDLVMPDEKEQEQNKRESQPDPDMPKFPDSRDVKEHVDPLKHK